MESGVETKNGGLRFCLRYQNDISKKYDFWQ